MKALEVLVGLAAVGVVGWVVYEHTKTPALKSVSTPTPPVPGPVGAVGAAGPNSSSSWWYQGLWMYEDAGWSLITGVGPFQLGGQTEQMVTGYPMFDQIGTNAPPFYYAGAWYWNGSSWVQKSQQANIYNGKAWVAEW